MYQTRLKLNDQLVIYHEPIRKLDIRSTRYIWGILLYKDFKYINWATEIRWLFLFSIEVGIKVGIKVSIEVGIKVGIKVSIEVGIRVGIEKCYRP